MAKKKNLHFSLSVLPNTPQWILTDELRLKQVLSNILGNAVKFTSTGGITLTLEYDKKRDNLQFHVRDSGPGIPVDKREIIFLAFQQADESTTRKYGGTGLGLSIAKNLIDKFGGNITVEGNGDDPGCTFHISLPYVDPPKQPPSPEISRTPKINRPASAPQLNTKLLIAEDNLVNQKVLLKMVNRQGFQADIANNGKEAYTMASQSEYQLIFMDIEMPDMDGKTSTKLIRTLPNYSSVPIIAITAHVMNNQQVEELIKVYHFDSVLTKPVTLHAIEKIIVNSLQHNKIT